MVVLKHLLRRTRSLAIYRSIDGAAFATFSIITTTCSTDTLGVMALRRNNVKRQISDKMGIVTRDSGTTAGS